MSKTQQPTTGYPKKYIEVCSEFRDRTIYPYVSDFDVLISPENGAPNVLTDAILSGTVWFTWKGGVGLNDQPISRGTVKSGPRGATSGSDGTIYLNQTDEATYPNSPLNYPYLSSADKTLMAQQPTYYNGYALNINGVTRLITGYNPTEGYVTVSLCFPLNVISAGATYTITDPSTASQILLPYIDVFQVISSSTDQAYNNWYIVDETQSHDTYILSRKIVSYVAATRCATLEWPMYNFGIDHTYTLRRSLPTAAYWVRNVIQPNKIQLPA